MDAVLIGPQQSECTVLSEREYKIVGSALRLARSGGWLASFLEFRMESWATKSPTPFEVMY